MPLKEGHSGYSTYSAIETLERQWAPPIGKRVLLFIRTNPNVYLAGGVEAILRSESAGNAPVSVASAMSELSVTEGESVVSPTSEDSTAANGDSSDPFAFLGQDGGTPVAGTPTNSKKAGGGIGGFFKKVAKTANTQIRQGMTSLAIRADGGKSPDWFVAGLYGKDGELLTMTDSQPLPMDESKKLNGLRFKVPLAIPGTVGDDDAVTIKLWVRSGAAMLNHRHFLVGEIPLTMKQLRGALPNFMTLTLQSNAIADAKLFVCALSDAKFPQLCGPGWSIADPDANVGYKGNLYHFPLDQSYGLVFPPDPSGSWLVATERSIESTVVLPIAAAFSKLAAEAGKISLTHAESLSLRVHAARHDSTIGEYVDSTFSILSLAAANQQEYHSAWAYCSASWQRPDSIFEVELLQPARVPLIPQTEIRPTLTFRFFPKPTTEGLLPSLLHASGGKLPACGFCLGSVRLQIAVSKTPVQNNVMENAEVWNCIIPLESLLATQKASEDSNAPVKVDFPVTAASGQQMGSISLSVTLKMKQGPSMPKGFNSAKGGLLSLVGLTPLCDWTQPALDVVVPDYLTTSPDLLTRQQQQLATMGMFLTHGYIARHVKDIRASDAKELEERAKHYNGALVTEAPAVPPNEDRSPKPFRPSSSRGERLLAGIPFNVHTASLSLAVYNQGSSAAHVTHGGVFANVTCGAPADHIRDFGNVFPKPKDSNSQIIGLTSPIGPVSGGLRRLEARRAELAKRVADLQVTLTMQVANFFVSKRQNKETASHVPAGDHELQRVRWALFESVQSLHHLTWHCAMRRTSCFSQALGTAVTSFLAALSDPLKWQSTWPELWAKHGYLCTFEGLLSAAGKELGMIEDASVGIAMLRNVKIILQPDDGKMDENKVPVISSPYLKWVKLTASHSGLAGSVPEYTLELGIVSGYYDQRIPQALKNGTPVQLYPLLFEVGVDIRQWGANTGEHLKNRLKKNESNDSLEDGKIEQPSVSVLDDEDQADDGTISDDDVLVEINYEAYHKLNHYAHLISPANSDHSSAAQKTHPLLEKLHQHIISSAGKMNHEILDEAAALSQQLGGGGIVFCKSGKDRTAMHVTFKQSQFANRYRKQNPPNMSGEGEESPFEDNTIEDATTMRVHGTRLPICEKCVGEAKYAFNSLQVKFMPDALKPPMSTLAGFLKGGKVFTGGAIES